MKRLNREQDENESELGNSIYNLFIVVNENFTYFS